MRQRLFAPSLSLPILAGLVSVGLSLAAPSSVVRAAGLCEEPQCGDLDQNGSTVASDALLLLRCAVGQSVTLGCAGGLSCWDLSGNGVCEPGEDVNSDGSCDALDCQGEKGDPGAPGASFACLQESGTDLVVQGCNLHVRNASGSTGGDVDGLGNLIVGYNEDADPAATRTGSHNLIVGPAHEWTSYGGLLAGAANTVAGEYASVTGGWKNTAAGVFSSVTGGYGNVALAPSSSISGGDTNFAEGYYSSVSGGQSNLVSNDYASISGGFYNTASGRLTSVSGGQYNTASSPYASVSGGSGNLASGNSASVSGGLGRTATNADSWVAGSLFEAN